MLVRSLLGYDAFISYAHADGHEYAHRLRDLLHARDLVAFLDTGELHGGESLSRALRAALKRTRRLVVVGTEAALDRPWIGREVAEFEKLGRQIVPIDIHGIRERQPWLDATDHVFLKEPLGSSGPSGAVVDAITDGLRKHRVLVRARRWAAIALLIAAVLVAAAIVSYERARAEQERSTTRAIARRIAAGRRAVQVDVEGWDEFVRAADLCEEAELDAFPVALACYLAQRGSRDFSVVRMTSRVPGVRVPAAHATLPAPVRALAWEGSDRVVVQDRDGRLWRWRWPDPPRAIDGHAGGAPLGGMGRIEIRGAELVHLHDDGLFAWDGRRDRLLREGAMRGFAEDVYVLDGTAHVGEQSIERGWRVASRDGLSVVGSQDGWAEVRCDLHPDGHRVAFGTQVTALDVHPVGVAVGGGDGRLRVYHSCASRDVSLSGHVGVVTGVSFSLERLLSTGVDGTTRVWDWPVGEEALRLLGRPGVTVRAGAWSPDETHIMTGDDEGGLWLWDVRGIVGLDGGASGAEERDRVEQPVGDWVLEREGDRLRVLRGEDDVASWVVPGMGTLRPVPGSLDLEHDSGSAGTERWGLDTALDAVLTRPGADDDSSHP